MAQVSFALLLHSHQPVGNFDHVIEEAYSKAYRPFVDLLARHPGIRVGLHYTGFLLQWIEKNHPEFFAGLRRLVERQQVELVSGGFYEPILPVIPDRDKRAQILKLTDFIRSRFGVTPRGAWLTERVWEPSLAKPLAEVGIEYIVLDDTHFTLAGVEAKNLNGYYYTEDAGLPLRLVPSIKSLRYTIPFREPAETMEILRSGLDSGVPASRRPLFAMGDDLEKFGGWPHTFEHCYAHGWLERFFQAVDSARDWLEVTTLADYLDRNPPLGRVYLPTASYEEMMTWALPMEAARELRACLAASDHLPEADKFRRFLRAGLWRNFLAKYPEANQMHKLMLEVGRRLQAAAASGASSADHAHLLSEAGDNLLASQCNDAYWHGVFGGLYTPHLRSGILGHLIRAECALDRLEDPAAPLVTRSDFDCDGSTEIQVRHRLYGMVLRPADGGTISALRFKPAGIELINSLARRPEEYHDEVRAQAHSHATRGAVPESIHAQEPASEPNLAEFLRYDRYARHVFRSYVFPAGKQWQDFEQLTLEESPELAGGEWTVSSEELFDSPGVVRIALAATARAIAAVGGAAGTAPTAGSAAGLPAGGCGWDLRAGKLIATAARGTTWRIECHSRFEAVAQALLPAQSASLRLEAVAPAVLPMTTSPLAFGLEMVFNLLAPDAFGRYFLASAEPSRYEPLKFRGELAGSNLLIVDEWQGVKISITAEPEPRWWIVPIETVSQAVEGFECVYQGSAILAVWKPETTSGTNLQTVESRVLIEVEPWRK
ncbi:MAG TPA: alpha-amylase/4-alpha-glucanotransferase domain-containing protein [Terriglobia bacterium]|nr:alpha-amylase/4-alpha-glucanotransferase domain-containing protein [Terriglobia bacterium]